MLTFETLVKYRGELPDEWANGLATTAAISIEMHTLNMRGVLLRQCDAGVGQSISRFPDQATAFTKILNYSNAEGDLILPMSLLRFFRKSNFE